MRTLFVVGIVLVASAAGCLQRPDRDGDADPGPPGPDLTDEEILARFQWRTHAQAPSPRTEVAAALAGPEVFVIGGFGADNAPVRTVDVYHTLEDRWRQAEAYPIPIHHTAAVSDGDTVFVLGGYTTQSFVPTTLGFSYDLEAKVWNATAPLPVARGAHAAVLMDGLIYLVGGVGIDGGLVAPVHVYNPVSRTWSAKAALPTPREHLAAAAVNGTIYAIGGRMQSLASNSDVVEAFDAVQGAWSAKAAMPTARGGIAAATLGDRVVVVGGEGSGGTFPQVEAFDPRTDSWLALKDLPSPRHGLGAVEARERVYTFLGGPQPGLTVSQTVESFGF